MSSLLPHNSTRLELALEAACSDDTPTPLRSIYNPDTCPYRLLPYLAWECSVDRWDEGWSEPVKRSVIRSAYYVHAHKGTVGALRRVIEPLGYLIDIEEWFQRVPEGVPGTFSLNVGVLDTGITEESYQELVRLIDDAKPVSRHLIELVITLASSGYMRLGIGLTEGEVIDVYPPTPSDIDVSGHFGFVGFEHQIEYLDVYTS